AQCKGRSRKDHDVREVPALQVLWRRTGHSGIRRQGDVSRAVLDQHNDRARPGAVSEASAVAGTPLPPAMVTMVIVVMSVMIVPIVVTIAPAWACCSARWPRT